MHMFSSAKLKGWKVEKYGKYELDDPETKGKMTKLQTVYMIKIGNKHLGVKVNDDVVKLVLKEKSPKEGAPDSMFAWIFERFYDDREPQPIQGAVSIMNVDKRRYLVDLVATAEGKSKGNKVSAVKPLGNKRPTPRHWVMDLQ